VEIKEHGSRQFKTVMGVWEKQVAHTKINEPIANLLP
jgi:hypothetical protein